MKKYIITIGCALVAQITHANADCYIGQRLERIERQLNDERDARFYDAFRHNDLNGMIDNM